MHNNEMVNKTVTLKEKIENNIAIWMFSILLAGFLAGFGSYKAILEITKMEVISKENLENLKTENKKLEDKNNFLVEELDKLGKILAKKEVKKEYEPSRFEESVLTEKEPIELIEVDENDFVGIFVTAKATSSADDPVQSRVLAQKNAMKLIKNALISKLCVRPYYLTKEAALDIYEQGKLMDLEYFNDGKGVIVKYKATVKKVR